MSRIYIYTFTLLGVTPFILMIAIPESLDFIYIHLKQGNRFVYFITALIFIFNVTNYIQMVSEAELQKVGQKNIKLTKYAMSINMVLPAIAYLSTQGYDLLQEIFMGSILFSIIVYIWLTYVAKKTT